MVKQAAKLAAAGDELDKALTSFAHTVNANLDEILSALRNGGYPDVADTILESHKNWCEAAGKAWEAAGAL